MIGPPQHLREGSTSLSVLSNNKAYLLLHLYLGGGFSYRQTMTECEGKERKVVLGVDASPHSERAFDCK